MRFNEIYQLIENTKPVADNSKNRNKLNDLLKQAYQERDLAVFIQLIKDGASKNLNVGSPCARYPLILRAALDEEVDFVCALALLGANIYHGIHWCFNYQENSQFSKALMILFDAATVGASINYEGFFDNLIESKINLNEFNFIGLSYSSQPLTPQLLQEKKLKLTGQEIFLEEDIDKISDPMRREMMRGYFDISIKKYGRCEINGILNLVSLQKSAEIGNEQAVITRINAGWNFYHLAQIVPGYFLINLAA